MLATIISVLITGYVLYWLLFDDWHEFLTAIKYTLTPNWLSFLRGDLGRDWTYSYKLFWWILGVAFMGMGIYSLRF